MRSLAVALFLISVTTVAQAQTPFQSAMNARDYHRAKEIFTFDIEGSLEGTSERQFREMFADVKLQDADFEIALILAVNHLYKFPFRLDFNDVSIKYNFPQQLGCTEIFFNYNEHGCQMLGVLEKSLRGDIDYQPIVDVLEEGKGVVKKNAGLTLPMTLVRQGYSLSLKTVLLANPNLELRDRNNEDVFSLLVGSKAFSNEDRSRFIRHLLEVLPGSGLSPAFYAFLEREEFEYAKKIVQKTQLEPYLWCRFKFSPLFKALSAIASTGKERRLPGAEELDLITTILRTQKNPFFTGDLKEVLLNGLIKDLELYKILYDLDPSIINLPISNFARRGWYPEDWTMLYALTDSSSFFSYWNVNAEESLRLRIQFAEFLLSHGANVNQPNQFGKTPLYYAREKELMLLFARHGADLDGTIKSLRDEIKGCSRCDDLKMRVKLIREVKREVGR